MADMYTLKANMSLFSNAGFPLSTNGVVADLVGNMFNVLSRLSNLSNQMSNFRHRANYA